MSNFIRDLLSSIQSNWESIVAIGVFISAFTYWYLQIKTIGKIRLEIQMLKKELEEKGTTKIPVANLEEIIEFASKDPDPRKVRKYIDHKFSEFHQTSEPAKLSPSQSQQFAEALMEIDRSISISGNKLLLQMAISFVIVTIMMSLIIRIFGVTVHPAVINIFANISATMIIFWLVSRLYSGK